MLAFFFAVTKWRWSTSMSFFRPSFQNQWYPTHDLCDEAGSLNQKSLDQRPMCSAMPPTPSIQKLTYTFLNHEHSKGYYEQSMEIESPRLFQHSRLSKLLGQRWMSFLAWLLFETAKLALLTPALSKKFGGPYDVGLKQITIALHYVAWLACSETMATGSPRCWDWESLSNSRFLHIHLETSASSFAETHRFLACEFRVLIRRWRYCGDRYINLWLSTVGGSITDILSKYQKLTHDHNMCIFFLAENWLSRIHGELCLRCSKTLAKATHDFCLPR